MKYRGFVIKPVERIMANGRIQNSSGIYYKERFMSAAAGNDLARRVIDEKLRTGLWKVDEE